MPQGKCLSDEQLPKYVNAKYVNVLRPHTSRSTSVRRRMATARVGTTTIEKPCAEPTMRSPLRGGARHFSHVAGRVSAQRCLPGNVEGLTDRSVSLACSGARCQHPSQRRCASAGPTRTQPATARAPPQGRRPGLLRGTRPESDN